jgi:hypothetical protein
MRLVHFSPPPTCVQALCVAGGVGCLYIARMSVAPHRMWPLSRKHRPRAHAVLWAEPPRCGPSGFALATRSRLGPVRTCPFPLAPSSLVQPLGVALATRSRLGPVRTCPFPLARACVGMRAWVCVCVQVGVLRMTSTARAAGQRARPDAAGTLSTHRGAPVRTVRPHTCGPSAGLLGCARLRVRTRMCPGACVGACARVCAC